MAFLFSPKVDFSSAVESIISNTQTFSYQTAAIISKLRGHQVAIGQAEEFHNAIHGLFKKAKEEISGVLKEIHDCTTSANQDQMFENVAFFSGFDTTLSEDYKIFNDVLLTYCPTAKIEYGDSCIKPADHPKTRREIRGDGNCFVSAFITRF